MLLLFIISLSPVSTLLSLANLKGPCVDVAKSLTRISVAKSLTSIDVTKSCKP